MGDKRKHTCCSVEGCTNKGDTHKGGEVFVRGYCPMHYQRVKYHGDPRYEVKHPTCCKVEGCQRKGIIKGNRETFNYGYCSAHYQIFAKYGTVDVPLQKCPSGHGVTEHPLYATWCSLRSRVTNPKHEFYKNYGGRGIKICDDWLGPHGFLRFAEDVGERPSKKHTLDRIDNNGHYEKCNMRWATRHVQNGNQRKNNKCVGVSWNKYNEKWEAYLTVDKKRHDLGLHEFYEDAVEARKKAEVEHGIVYSNPKIQTSLTEENAPQTTLN